MRRSPARLPSRPLNQGQAESRAESRLRSQELRRRAKQEARRESGRLRRPRQTGPMGFVPLESSRAQQTVWRSPTCGGCRRVRETRRVMPGKPFTAWKKRCRQRPRRSHRVRWNKQPSMPWRLACRAWIWVTRRSRKELFGEAPQTRARFRCQRQCRLARLRSRAQGRGLKGRSTRSLGRRRRRARRRPLRVLSRSRLPTQGAGAGRPSRLRYRESKARKTRPRACLH